MKKEAKRMQKWRRKVPRRELKQIAYNYHSDRNQLRRSMCELTDPQITRLSHLRDHSQLPCVLLSQKQTSIMRTNVQAFQGSTFPSNFLLPTNLATFRIVSNLFEFQMTLHHYQTAPHNSTVHILTGTKATFSQFMLILIFICNCGPPLDVVSLFPARTQ